MSNQWREYRVKPGRDDPRITYVLVGIVAVMAVVGQFFPTLLNWFYVGTSSQISFEYWRLVAYVFTSGSLLNGLINAAVLFWVARGLESELGPSRVAGLFLIAGFAAASALVVVGPLATINGAFCGVFGIFAGYAVLKHRARMDIRPDIVLLALLVVWSIVSGGRDWVGQLAAIAAGALLGMAHAYGGWKNRTTRVALSAGGIVLVGVLAATAHWLQLI